MNVRSNCKTRRFKRHSEALLVFRKSALVNKVSKLFKRLFSYTRVNVSWGFVKPFCEYMAVSVFCGSVYKSYISAKHD